LKKINRQGALIDAACYGMEQVRAGAGRFTHSIGGIGPTRMNYERVIPLVKLTAQVLSKALFTEVAKTPPP